MDNRLMGIDGRMDGWTDGLTDTLACWLISRCEIGQIKTTRRYVWTKRESTEEGQPLKEIVDHVSLHVCTFHGPLSFSTALLWFQLCLFVPSSPLNNSLSHQLLPPPPTSFFIIMSFFMTHTFEGSVQRLPQWGTPPVPGGPVKAPVFISTK